MSDQHPSTIVPALARDFAYSLRRYFVDDFHFRHVSLLPARSHLLDLGGNRIGKRGGFDIEQYGFQVVYANLSLAKTPDLQADAGCLPFPMNRFDGVICSELLEHVMEPRVVLAEIHRVLRPGGLTLICVPFLKQIHGDPYDYGRYTDFYWQENLARIGFNDIHVEKQGLFWSVLVDMIRDFAYDKTTRGGIWSRSWMLKLVSFGLGVCKQKAVKWDSRAVSAEGDFPHKFTTGFGITAVKR